LFDRQVVDLQACILFLISEALILIFMDPFSLPQIASGLLIAGDFIRISFFEVYVVLLLYSIPGILFSLPFLFKAFDDRKKMLVLSVLFWIFVLPVLVFLFTAVIAPDIYGRSHAYSAWQHVLFIWIPRVFFPPLLAGALWYRRKKSVLN
jgi:hypothetical protein